MTSEEMKQAATEITELAECIRVHMLCTATLPEFFEQLRQTGVEPPGMCCKMVREFRRWRDSHPGEIMHTRELWSSVLTTAQLFAEEAERLEAQEASKT